MSDKAIKRSVKRFKCPLNTTANRLNTGITSDTSGGQMCSSSAQPQPQQHKPQPKGFVFFTAKDDEQTISVQKITKVAKSLKCKVDETVDQLMVRNDVQLVPEKAPKNPSMADSKTVSDELFQELGDDFDDGMTDQWITKALDSSDGYQSSAKRSNLEPMVCGPNAKKSRQNEL